jgi:transcription elongation GreA/GreB family factor
MDRRIEISQERDANAVCLRTTVLNDNVVIFDATMGMVDVQPDSLVVTNASDKLAALAPGAVPVSQALPSPLTIFTEAASLLDAIH